MSTPSITLHDNLHTNQRQNYGNGGYVHPITASIEQSGITELSHLNRLRRLVCAMLPKFPVHDTDLF